MQHSTGSMKIISSAFLIIVISLSSFAQTKDTLNPKKRLIVNGKLKIDNGNVKGVTITLTMDSVVVKTILDSGTYDFELEYNHRYIIALYKEGYITKSVEILTTNVPILSWNDFDPYRMQQTLFKQPLNKIVTYTQPIATVSYRKDIDNFDFTSNYNKTEIDK